MYIVVYMLKASNDKEQEIKPCPSNGELLKHRIDQNQSNMRSMVVRW